MGILKKGNIDRGKELMLKVILAVEEFGMAESMPSMEGKKMFATIKPKSK
jgi:translation initiation factor IF-3